MTTLADEIIAIYHCAQQDVYRAEANSDLIFNNPSGMTLGNSPINISRNLERAANSFRNHRVVERAQAGERVTEQAEKVTELASEWSFSRYGLAKRELKPVLGTLVAKPLDFIVAVGRMDLGHPEMMYGSQAFLARAAIIDTALDDIERQTCDFSSIIALRQSTRNYGLLQLSTQNL